MPHLHSLADINIYTRSIFFFVFFVFVFFVCTPYSNTLTAPRRTLPVCYLPLAVQSNPCASHFCPSAGHAQGHALDFCHRLSQTRRWRQIPNIVLYRKALLRTSYCLSVTCPFQDMFKECPPPPPPNAIIALVLELRIIGKT